MQLISYSIILLCTLETLVEFWEVFAGVLTLAASYALKTYNVMQVRSIAIYLATWLAHAHSHSGKCHIPSGLRVKPITGEVESSLFTLAILFLHGIYMYSYNYELAI